MTEEIIKLYTKRHGFREDVFGDKPYANLGYWDRDGMTLAEACDALTDLVASTARLGPGDRVLEVGCGYGASAVYYTQRYRPSSVIGIDATEIRIKAGQEYIAQQGLGDVIQLRLGDATSLEFEEATFTKVLAIECAFHFDTRQDFLREAARVLAPGGILAMTDVIPKRRVDPKKFLDRGPPVLGEVCLEIPANAYDADVYAGYLKEAGFEAIRVESINDKTRLPFADHMDRLARERGGDRGAKLATIAQRHREQEAAGADYVLVAAHRSTSTPAL
jgi:ubiquinone/menaquinone biosynthesis C-methylase UbiE